MFKVGDKVVCVEPGSGWYLTDGQEYTITGVSDVVGGYYTVKVDGVFSEFTPGQYANFSSERFKFAEEQKTYFVEDEYGNLYSDYEIPEWAVRVWEIGPELFKKTSVTWEKKDV